MVGADPFLTMQGIVKHFPGAKALDGVDLDVRTGEVHCVLGQNGAGKSTLIKVLSGAHAHDAGQIRIDGEEVTLATPATALRAGIATMYQELDVVAGLTVAENIFLGNERSVAGLTRRQDAAHAARDLLTRLGHPEISPYAEVGELAAAGQQIVSMARALSRDARLLIMDEPSAVLDSEEVENLFRVVRDLTTSGIAVIYISHRLEEIRRVGDRITVLKDGRTVASGLDVAETSTPELITLMTGRTREYAFTPRKVPADAEEILQVQGLALEGTFAGVDLSVRAGQVVGLAGLVGAGRSEILETILGARRRTAGTVLVDGVALPPGSVPRAVAAGVGLCPEERKSQGLILDEPVFKNLTLSSFVGFSRGGFLREHAERAATATQMRNLELRPADPDRAIRTLSGGNQQKVMLGRWLEHGCRVLLLDEPTRGVDVGARAEIYDLIGKLADSGTAIVVVSSEIPEVLALADTVLVVADGRIVHTGPAAEIDEHRVLDLVMDSDALVEGHR